MENNLSQCSRETTLFDEIFIWLLLITVIPYMFTEIFSNIVSNFVILKKSTIESLLQIGFVILTILITFMSFEVSKLKGKIKNIVDRMWVPDKKVNLLNVKTIVEEYIEGLKKKYKKKNLNEIPSGAVIHHRGTGTIFIGHAIGLEKDLKELKKFEPTITMLRQTEHFIIRIVILLMILLILVFINPSATSEKFITFQIIFLISAFFSILSGLVQLLRRYFKIDLEEKQKNT